MNAQNTADDIRTPEHQIEIARRLSEFVRKLAGN
jgi:hypothetical protein